MKISELKILIKEIILSETKPRLTSDSELESALTEYKKTKESILKLEKENKLLFDKIKDLNTTEKSLFGDISKYMIRFNKSMIRVDNWVAELQEKLKYTDPAKGVSYKELYLNLKDKINGAMKTQEEAYYQSQLDAARLAKEIKLNISSISEANISTFMSKLYTRIKSAFNKIFMNTTKFESLVNNLPKIK